MSLEQYTRFPPPSVFIFTTTLRDFLGLQSPSELYELVGNTRPLSLFCPHVAISLLSYSYNFACSLQAHFPHLPWWTFANTCLYHNTFLGAQFSGKCSLVSPIESGLCKMMSVQLCSILLNTMQRDVAD